MTFKAYWVEEQDGSYRRRVVERTLDDLPDSDVLIEVRYSSLNYKDALSASGNRGVTRRYPHTPGIDAAGVVLAGSGPDFAPGDAVVVIGFDLGMNTPGGFGQRIRVPAGWVVALPAGLSLRESMRLGTAGFTAALAVHKLQAHGMAPGLGPVLVTGATGGVGSVAVKLLESRPAKAQTSPCCARPTPAPSMPWAAKSSSMRSRASSTDAAWPPAAWWIHRPFQPPCCPSCCAM